jgi:hypothetical protein
VGNAKEKYENNSDQEKRWNHRCRTKEAFSVNESTLGGKKERDWEEINQSGTGVLPLPASALS